MSNERKPKKNLIEKLTRLQQITSPEVEFSFQSVSKLIKTREVLLRLVE